MVTHTIYLASLSFPGINNLVLGESNTYSNLITALKAFPTINNSFTMCEFITPKDGQVLISEKIVVTHLKKCGHTYHIFG
jgi:hypothetical protein